MKKNTITWTNCKVKLIDLKPWDKNPRKSTKEQSERILESVNEFGQVDVLAIGPDNEVYNGHQRLGALLIKYGGGYEVDARRSSRKLTEEERKKLTILLHAGAAMPNERMEVLRIFHDAGIFTWVSLEPTLDTDTSLQIVRETHEFVDFYKIGRANYLPMTKTTDWKSYTERMIELCNQLGVKHYIKKDLQPFLPEGYSNIKVIPQHH